MEITPQRNIKQWFSNPEQFMLIAGPCSAESEEQVLASAFEIEKLNQASIFRAGVWKPRTKPGSFEGIGLPALPWLKKVKEHTSLKVATEVASAFHVEQALKFDLDILWIGARSTVNPFLVQEIAEALRGVDIPILVKNPIHAEIALWDGALQRLSQVGIKSLGAIHRGFFSSNSSPFRNLPSWEIAVELRQMYPQMPIITDPSHIAGDRKLISSVSQTALDLNFDGLIVETHINPDAALSDAKQQVTPKVLGEIISNLTYKEQSSQNPEYLQTISKLRDELNLVDEDFLNLLKKRVEVVTRIEQFKKDNKLSAFEFKRLNEILETRTKRGKELGLGEEFVEDIYRLLFKNTFKIGNNLK